jgi:transcriptional regulator with XRE-family HTH domain
VLLLRQVRRLTDRGKDNNNAAAVADERRQETIGGRVRRLRLERGLSQRQLAGPGTSYAYLSRIESGQRQPSLKALRAIAAKLDVSPEYLETGAAIPAVAERELRLRDAELELRLGRDLEKVEKALRGLVLAHAGDAVEARALAALGMLAAQRGDNSDAVRQLERATDSPYIRPERRSDVYEALATAFVAVGAPRQAVKLLEGCIAEIEERVAADVTLQIRYRVLLGTTLSSFGEIGRAREVLAEATKRGEGYGNPSARVLLYWSLARVDWMQGDSESALSYMARAIGLLEASDDTLQLARAQLVTAQICNLDKRYEEARPHLDQAERLLVLAAEADDLGVLRAEQAKQLAHTGDYARAIACGEEAVALVKDDSRFAPVAWHGLAVARASVNDPAAEAAFQLAVEGLSELRQWRQAAQAARDWADMLRKEGREDEAYSLLERAMMLSFKDAGIANA